MKYTREPVGNTCPDIDAIIGLLEELRESNAKLRDWGKEEAERVDELEATVSYKDKEIEKLENKVSDLEDELKSLETDN